MTDLGKYLRCVVTASNASGAGTPAASNAVGPVAAAPAAASTWNPSDKTTNLELSGDNLTGTVDTSAGFTTQYARGTASKATGKRYLEFQMILGSPATIVDSNIRVGLVDGTHTLGSGIPGSVDSKGFYLRIGQTGDAFLYAAVTDSVIKYLDGHPVIQNNDVVGIAVDLDANSGKGEITAVYINGTLRAANSSTLYPWNWGSSAEDALFPYMAAQWQGVGSLSVKLIASAPFALATLPSGYVAWDT